MDRGAVLLVGLPIAAVAIVVYLLVARVVRRRQIARFARLAPGQYAFTFASNGWYQEALRELRDRGLIAETANDALGAEVAGPRWASASSTTLAIRHGYAIEPLFSLPWSQIEAITDRVPPARGRYSQSESGIDVLVRTPQHPAHLLLLSPNTRVSALATRHSATEVATELNRLRVAAASARG